MYKSILAVACAVLAVSCVKNSGSEISRSWHGHSGREPFPDSGAVRGADQSGADYHGEDERRDAGRSVESDENLDSALRPDKGGSRPRGDLHARGRVSERFAGTKRSCFRWFVSRIPARATTTTTTW